MTTFEKGMGDVVVTYENELLLRNRDTSVTISFYPAHYPYRKSAALVDKNVDKHGNREVVEAFVDFLSIMKCRNPSPTMVFGRWNRR
jgi:sulfate transport system substrate-binding protein